MAEEKQDSRVSENTLIGENSTYTLTDTCYATWDTLLNHGKSAQCWIFEATCNPPVTPDGRVLIFQINLRDSGMYEEIKKGISLGIRHGRRYEKITGNTREFPNRSSQIPNPSKFADKQRHFKFPDELYGEFAKSILKYVAMHKTLGSFYPDCDMPYFNCILDTVVDKPCIYIVTKYVKYQYLDLTTNPWILTEVLRGLQFFHAHNFVYKYISFKTVLFTEDRKVQFGFGMGNGFDPLFKYGLISQADFKSDVWSLTDDTFMIDGSIYETPWYDPEKPIDEIASVFSRSYAELTDLKLDPVISHLFSRMSCFFSAVRPTVEQALWILGNNQDHPDLPTVGEYIAHVKYTQTYLEDKKYCAPVGELTVINLMHQDYLGMYEKAERDHDQVVMNLIVNSPFAENVRKMFFLRENMESQRVFDPEHPENHMKMMGDLYDKNLPGLISKFV